MRILHRYILREMIGPFVLSFAVILFLLIVDLILQMMDLLLKKGVGAGTVFELFFLSLAWMIALAVPMSVLVTTLMTFSRLSADNELVAMKASGISLYWLISPVLLVSVVLAVLLALFNDRILPEFNHRAGSLISAIRRKKPTLALKDREGTFINDFEGYNLMVEKVDDRRSALHGITIYQRQEGEFPIPIRAERGEFRFSEDGNHLMFVLYNGEIHRIDRENPGKYIRTSFKKHVLNISNVGQKLMRTLSRQRSDREMTIRMMREKIDSTAASIDRHQASMAKAVEEYMEQYLPERVGADYRPPLVVSSGTFAKPPSEGMYTWPLDKATDGVIARIQGEANMIGYRQRTIYRYEVEIHKKFSIPAACIVFVLIGVPLGVMGRSGPAVGVGVSLGFFVLYWAFLIGGEGLADRGFVSPATAMWAPNVLIGGAGVYLLLRMGMERNPFRRAGGRRQETGDRRQEERPSC